MAPEPKPPTAGPRRIQAVVIGGSAGAWTLVQELLGGLGPDYPVPIVLVLHVNPEAGDLLAETLGLFTRLAVVEAEDKMPALPGRVHTAPAGYHLLVGAGGRFALADHEPVHWCRPSIDVSFESAAEAWGPGLLAVLLSGANEDGAAGLGAVLRRGGLTVAQDPAEAEFPTMPAAAVAGGWAGRILPAARIADLLLRLGRQGGVLDPP